MDDRIRRQAVLYTAIALVDHNAGSVVINGNIKRIFNDEDDLVKVEYADGRIGLACDANTEELDQAIRKWREEHTVFIH